MCATCAKSLSPLMPTQLAFYLNLKLTAASRLIGKDLLLCGLFAIAHVRGREEREGERGERVEREERETKENCNSPTLTTMTQEMQRR